jgi:dihydroxyacetone kinase-like protein
MGKLINNLDNVVREMLEGFARAYPGHVALTESLLIVRRIPKVAGRVGLVIGNGSGHEPAMIGWVGTGLLDVNVPGEIFTAPDPMRMAAGIAEAERGAGVLLLVSSHAGDVLNAEMAVEIAREERRRVETVRLYDDVASAPKAREDERRGGAGLFFVWKIVGALAEAGAPLDACARMAERVRDRTRTVTLALRAGTHPLSGAAMFELSPDEMEIGMGVHGEAGRGRMPRLSADAAIDRMAEWVLDDRPFDRGDEVLVLLNNAGGMTLMELFILNRRLAQVLDARGIAAHRTWIGSYATTQETAGFALSLCAVDEEMKRLYEAPADAPYFRQC